MVRKIADILKVEPLVKFVKDRPGHVKRHAINGPKIATTSDALANTVNWYKDNQQWIKLVTDTEEYRRYTSLNYDKR